MTTILSIKKGQSRRIRAGHPWVYSNEINTTLSPLKSFSAGQVTSVLDHDGTFLGKAYVNPHSLISARIFTRDSTVDLNQEFFIQQIQNALALRAATFSKSYYRLVFSEADNLPGIVIDRFNNDFVMQINTAGMEQQLDVIVAAMQTVFPDLNSLLLRNDSPVREQEGLSLYVKAAIGTPPETLELEENGVRFTTPLIKGQKTGWFYDHRMNRSRLRDYVRDKNVLDVFSYVGGWGIQAAAFGAKHVDCIEVSEFACSFIKSNAQLNGLNNVDFICADAFDALKDLLRAGKQYDVIIMDPPAFVKRFKDKKEGLLAYQRVNELAVKLLVPGGILFSCSCSMHVSIDDLVEMLPRIAYRTQSTLQILERGHQGPDHPIHICIPETDYLKAVVVRKLA